ncbi:MAG TPA: hypothetical protein VGB39_01715 [Sphingomicrobium sp.]
MTLSDILRRNRDDIALVIGNGVHRHGPPQVNSWEDLLTDLAHQSGVDRDGVPHGASATEFFDILELRAQTRSGVLAEAFCGLMRDWRPLNHHRRIMQWAAQRGVPVLTTNFDEVLSAAAEAELMRPRGGGFTDFYPWDSRFAHSPARGSLRWLRHLAYQRYGALRAEHPARSYALYGIRAAGARLAASRRGTLVQSQGPVELGGPAHLDTLGV